jgi:hypothetical protein
VRSLHHTESYFDPNLLDSFPALRALDLGELHELGPALPTLVESTNERPDTVEKWHLRSFSFLLLGNDVLPQLANKIDPTMITTLRFCLSHMDVEELRELVGSLMALEELIVELETDMEYDGKYAVCTIISHADLHLTDLNLGVIHVSRLHLAVLPNHYEVVPLIFRFLQETTLPGLRHLTITLDTLWPLLFGSGVNTFDPIRYLDEDDSGIAHTWELDHSLAARLESLVINLHALDALEHANEFFQLFGTANRPGVLRVLPEHIQLLG